MSAYDSMTMKQLQAEFVVQAAIFVASSNARTEILGLMEKRKAGAVAKFGIDRASELEKDALRTLLSVEAAR